jgi:hypothetical protein
MPRRFYLYLLPGLAVIALVVALSLWSNRGAQVRLESRILKTRLVATEEKAAVAILEVRIENPANIRFVVRALDFFVIDARGRETPGMVVAQVDLDRVLDYYKDAGPRYNPVLVFQQALAPRSTSDRTLAAQFPFSASDLDARRAWRIRIEDVDGAVVEIREKR